MQIKVLMPELTIGGYIQFPSPVLGLYFLALEVFFTIFILCLHTGFLFYVFKVSKDIHCSSVMGRTHDGHSGQHYQLS